MNKRKRDEFVFLTAFEDKNAGVPPGGKWFKKKKHAKAYANALYGEGLGFVAAWAYAGKGYCYGVYASYDECLSCTLKLKVGRRYGFEMIRAENGCNLYFDVEGIIEDPTDEEQIRARIVEKIQKGLWRKYNANFGLQITRGSRQTDKGFKLSYHIVVTGLVFSNNYGGAMKSFVLEIKESLAEADQYFIDLIPYSRDGLMRMVLSSKRGSDVPLRNVTGDPLSTSATLFLERDYEDSEAGARGNCSITQHINNLFTSTYVEGNAIAASRPVSSRKKSTSSCQTKAITQKQCAPSADRMDSVFPADIGAILQEAMDHEKSQGCVVGGNYVYEQGRFFVYCKISGTRHCIANDTGHMCENENAYLSFEGGYVKYRCRSHNCARTSHIQCVYPTLLKKFFADFSKSDKGGCSRQKRIRADDDDDEEVAPDLDYEEVAPDLDYKEMAVSTYDTAMEGDDTGRYWYLPQYDKPHFPFPELEKYHQDRAKRIDQKFLDKEIYNDGVRLHVVESSCCTGKTKSAFDYARDKNLQITALATRISQLNAHEEVITLNLETSERYDSKSLAKSAVGKHHLLSTIDSVSRIVYFLKRDPDLAKHYILFLDEFHSIVQYLYSSQTLVQKRRSVLQDIQWLIREAKQVIVADNTLSNHDFYFLESALNEDDQHVELTFHINEYQTFKGVPAVHISDREKLYQKILLQFHAGVPFVLACNTKADAKYFKQRLWDSTTDVKLQARIRFYTGDMKGSTNIAQEVKLWYVSFVIYSPKISTGIDYHPETPIDVFYVGRGEDTVCPATAIQMVTRTRSINTLYICLDRMRTAPRYKSEAEMNAHLDMLQNSYQKTTQSQMPELSALCELNERSWCSRTLKDVYSENKFSKGYRGWLWHQEVMKSSWVFNFNTYLRKRGFVVTEEESGAKIRLQHPAVRNNVMEKCDQDLKAAFSLWRNGDKTIDAELFDDRLASVREFKKAKLEDHSSQLPRAKLHLNAAIDLFQGYAHKDARARIYSIFLSSAMTIRNQNMLFSVYTLEKLLKIKEHDHTVDYNLPNAQTVCTSVLLLRELIGVFNRRLPARKHLKTYDITISQSAYNENKRVIVPKHIWQLFLYNCRSVKPIPTTRKALMSAICQLSHRIFGKSFTAKTVTFRTKTCKNGKRKQVRCYNYSGDDMFLRVHVHLADWSERELTDIDPVIVAKYNLEELQKRDIENCIGAVKNRLQKKYKMLQQTKFNQKAKHNQLALKKNMFVDGMHHSSKRHKSVDLSVDASAVVVSPCVVVPAAVVDELRDVQLKRQKQWHLKQDQQVVVLCSVQKQQQQNVPWRYLLQTSAHDTSVVDLRTEHARQCGQRRKQDSLEHMHSSLATTMPLKFVDYLAPESDNRVDPQKDVNVTVQRVEIAVQTKIPAGKNAHAGAFLLKKDTHVYLP